MKILVVGGNSGTIGKTVAAYLSKKHEVITAGRNGGDVLVNIESAESIKNMFEQLDDLDAVVSCVGAAKWGAFEDLSEEDYYVGIKSKLMGQVNLVRIGKEYVKAGASFTLTTGILADDPVKGATNSAMVNNAIHGFVRAASQELKNGLRLNAVAPGLVEDSAERLGDAFPGHTPVPMDKVAAGYVRSVEGLRTGEIIRVY
ncbi:short chain dehydrogenase [Maribellus sediminis]|uniref:short chain dehydrogenase n=1 Tax=Maribellus sediminis TaxID=2696285 RepID=UPI0014304982|nr:short chain dehydrogenase [Maribellus sediminis]